MRDKRPTMLRKIREATGKRQAQVADELGVGKSVYNAWETGRNEVSASQLVALSRYFGCTPNDILGYDAEDSTYAQLSVQEEALVRLFRSASVNVRTSIVTILQAVNK